VFAGDLPRTKMITGWSIAIGLSCQSYALLDCNSDLTLVTSKMRWSNVNTLNNHRKVQARAFLRRVRRGSTVFWKVLVAILHIC